MTVMVRYRVKPDQSEHNEALIRAVYEELQAVQPADFRYATFKLDDGVSFVHIATAEGRSPLPDIAAFKRFQDRIAERCDEPPVVVELEEVGSYRMFG